MRKIFLTSGVILCMACPAFATTDITYNSQSDTYSAEGYDNPTCVADITGQTENNSDAEFDAIWSAITYQISYAGGTASNNGHSHNVTATTMGNQNATFDASVTMTSNTYAVTGYSFNNWSCTGNKVTNGVAASSTDTYSDGATINPYNYASNLACTATWTPDTYNVVYNKGAGAGSNYTHTNGATYDGAYSIPSSGDAGTGVSGASTPQPGYTFIGWTTDSSPVVTRSSGTAPVNTGTVANAWTGTSQWTETSAKTVYAAYLANQYTLTYAGGDSHNDGTGTPAAGSTTATVVTYGSSATVATNGFTLNGYGFSGWSCENTTGTPSGTFTYNNGQTVNPWDVAGNLLCTAQWTAGTTAVAYSCGTGNDISGTEPTSDTATFDSSYQFAANTGSCAKTGHTFAGWSCPGINGTQAAESSITWALTGASVTCTAVYNANTINLTWYNDTAANNGTAINVAGTDAASCTYGDTIDLPENNPEKTGYTFQGWTVRSAQQNP